MTMDDLLFRLASVPPMSDNITFQSVYDVKALGDYQFPWRTGMRQAWGF